MDPDVVFSRLRCQSSYYVYVQRTKENIFKEFLKIWHSTNRKKSIKIEILKKKRVEILALKDINWNEKYTK